MTGRDLYPSPEVDVCIDSFGDAKVFAAWHMYIGHRRIKVHKSNKKKTAFTSHEGPHEVTRVPIGLYNALATMQLVVDLVSSFFKW